MKQIIKTCACGRSYTAEQWACLHKQGTFDDEVEGKLELRNCVCGSTCAIVLGHGTPAFHEERVRS